MAVLQPRALIITATITAAAGTAYYKTRRPLLLDSAGTASPTQTFSFPKSMIFARDLTVTSIEQVNHDTKRITFSLPGGAHETTGVPAGSAILTQHTPNGGWVPVFRPYTPVHDTSSQGVLKLLVKQYPHGVASTHLHSLQPGSKLTVRGPLPGYTWKPSQTPREVLFVAGGAGITPLYSLARAVVADTRDMTRINLIWGVNGTKDIILKQELEMLEHQCPDKLRVTYVVSGPEGRAHAPSLGAADKYMKGYIDHSILQKMMQSITKDNLGDEKGTKVFFCGPPSMQASLTGRGGVLSQLGIEKKNTHVF